MKYWKYVIYTFSITVPTSIKATTVFGASKMMTTLRFGCFVNINAINRVFHGHLGMRNIIEFSSRLVIVCLAGTDQQLNERSSI